MGRRFTQAGDVDSSSLVRDNSRMSGVSTHHMTHNEDKHRKRKLKKSTKNTTAVMVNGQGKENGSQAGKTGDSCESIFQRQLSDGSTSLAILTPGDGIIPGTERDRPISLGNLIGRVKYGSSTLSPFREDKRNMVKPMLPIAYNMFSSFGPVYDSTFSNVTVEESRLIMSSDQPATKRRFLDRNDNKDLIRSVCVSAHEYYTNTFVDHIIDIFEGKEVKDDDLLVKSTADGASKADEQQTGSDNIPGVASDVVVDFDSLKSLAEDGIDMSFVDGLQPRYENRLIEGAAFATTSAAASESSSASPNKTPGGATIDQRLQHTASLLVNLRAKQAARLNATPPLNLTQVAGPSEYEMRLAGKVVENLTSMIGSGAATPQHVASVEAIRKTMGVVFPEDEAKADQKEDKEEEANVEEKDTDNKDSPVKEGNSDQVKPSSEPKDTSAMEVNAKKEQKGEKGSEEPTASTTAIDNNGVMSDDLEEEMMQVDPAPTAEDTLAAPPCPPQGIDDAIEKEIKKEMLDNETQKTDDKDADEKVASGASKPAEQVSDKADNKKVVDCVTNSEPPKMEVKA